jgi:NADPH-dependent ferric siderophore reductase
MRDLSAQTRIDHADAVALMRFFRTQHGDFEVDPGRQGVWTFQTPYGVVDGFEDQSGLAVRITAPDETFLAYLKMGIVNHAARLFGDVSIGWTGDGSTASQPAFFRELTVLETRRLGPHMQRVRFAGRDLARFAHGGLHVRLLFPPAGRLPIWPSVVLSGALVWPSGEDELAVRLYTVRHVDAEAGWIEIDFVLHGGHGSPGVAFAGNATAGAVVGMLGPTGEDTLDASHLVLFGDDAAIPAVARLLEAMPATARADVFIEVDGTLDEQPLPAGDWVRTTWLHRNGREAGSTTLLLYAAKAFDATTLASDAFVWAGSEYAAARAIREYVRVEWKLPRERHLVAAYWRRGRAGGEPDSD